MARKLKPSGNKSKKRSLNRESGNKRPRKSILIVCEGKETEPIYFRAFRLASVQVKVMPGTGKTASLQIVNRAIDLRRQREQNAEQSMTKAKFDEVWCVFDRENVNENTSFDQAITLAKNEGIKLAVSNPAFEYWFLLHFEETTKSFKDATALTRQLKKHIPKYEKSTDVFDFLQPATTDAIARSKRVLKNLPDKDERFPNPSTHVHKLVEELID